MRLVHALGDVDLWQGDARTVADCLPVKVDAVVTSPPYWMCRDYEKTDQLGHEPSVGAYVADLADIMDRIGRGVMVDGGSLWVNLGDVYGRSTRALPYGFNERYGNSVGRRKQEMGRPSKQARAAASQPTHRDGKGLALIPERFAVAMSDLGWMVRNRVVWHKTNAMPTSATDRLATRWEYLFHLVRSSRYVYDLKAIRVPHAEVSVRRGKTDPDAPMGDRWLHPDGANPGDVWAIATSGISDLHFAPFPVELVRRPILATVPEGGVVLDPFVGSGTTCVAARMLGRRSVGVDLNASYLDIALRRLDSQLTLVPEAL